MELWRRGLCLASPDVLDQPSLYGVDVDNYQPFNIGVDSVVVPETVLSLTPDQLAYIQHHHPPLTPSDYLGLDLYLSLCYTVSRRIA